MEFEVSLPDSLEKVRDPTYRERMGIADVAFKHTKANLKNAQLPVRIRIVPCESDTLSGVRIDHPLLWSHQ